MMTGCEGSFKVFVDLIRKWELKMSCREGRVQLVIFWVVLILCKAALSVAEQLVYQEEMQYSQEVKSLVGLLDDMVGLCIPGEILCNVCAR